MTAHTDPLGTVDADTVLGMSPTPLLSGGATASSFTGWGTVSMETTIMSTGASLPSTNAWRFVSGRDEGATVQSPWRMEWTGASRSAEIADFALWVTASGARWDATDVLTLPGRLVFAQHGSTTYCSTFLAVEDSSVKTMRSDLVERVRRIIRGNRLSERTNELSIAAESVSAIRDLERWLVRGREEIADLCRFSVRSPYNWSQGTSPRPSTTRRLYEVHALVRSLVRSMGPRSAREWLEEVDADGRPRIAVLAERDGPALVLREAASLLVTAPLRETPRSDAADQLDAEEAARQFERTVFSGPVARPRRPPSESG